MRQMATLSHLRVGPLKTESVHPHRQELLEFPGASAGKPCHTKLGSMLPALTGVERSMPTADGGSEGVPGYRNRPSAMKPGARVTDLLTHPNEGITTLPPLPIATPIKECQSRVAVVMSPLPEGVLRAPAHPQQYLGWFNVGTTVQLPGAICCQSSSPRSLEPPPHAT